MAERSVWSEPRLLLIGLGTLVVPLDGAVNTAFPAITAHFGIPIPQIQWVVICYVLTHASLMLACGRVGDMFGHRRIFRIGLAWSAVAYLLCATAPNYGWLLFCRVLQGIGAALVLSCGPALATSLFPEAMRPRVLAAWAAMFAAGMALGPSLGGLLVRGLGWEAVYWIRTPIALAALGFVHTLPAPQVHAVREPFDMIGAALLAACLSALLLGLNRLPVTPELAMALGAAGLLLLAAFIWRELHFPHPMIDLRPFSSGEFSLLNVGNTLVSFAAFAVPLLAPYFLVQSAHLDVLTTGALLAAPAFAAMLSASLAGRLLGRIPARVMAPGGAALIGLGLFASSCWTAASLPAVMAAGLLLQGIGVGVYQVAYLEIVTATVPAAQRGVAGSLVQLTRTIGVVSAATVLMLLFQGDQTAGHGFDRAFRNTFFIAALLPGAVAALGLARQLIRR